MLFPIQFSVIYPQFDNRAFLVIRIVQRTRKIVALSIFHRKADVRYRNAFAIRAGGTGLKEVVGLGNVDAVCVCYSTKCKRLLRAF